MLILYLFKMRIYIKVNKSYLNNYDFVEYLSKLYESEY